MSDLNLTFATYYHDKFRKKLRRTISQRTIVDYDCVVRTFLEFAGDGVLIADITIDMIGRFAGWLSERGLGQWSGATYPRIVRRIVANATPRPRKPRKPRKKPKVKLLSAPRATRFTVAPPGTLERFYVSEFERQQLAECNQRTKNQFRTAINKLAEYVGRYTPLDEFGRELIDDFREWAVRRCGNNLTPGKYASCLRRILRAYRPSTPLARHHPSKIVESEATEGSVRWFFESRYLSERIMGDKYRTVMRSRLRAFHAHLSREPMLVDLNAPCINEYLQSLLSRRMSPWTVQGHKAALRALWQSAFDWELLSAPPGRLLKIPKPALMPKAWSTDELRRLLAACDDPRFDRLRGGCVPLGKFLRAAILLAYDTGLRLGDMLSATWQQLGTDGTLPIAMGKTGFSVVALVAPETVAALRVIQQSDDPRLLPWPVIVNKLWRDFRRLLRAAGLPLSRHGGSFQKIRRTSASFVEADQPGAGSQHLGHRSASLANRHYLDPSIARKPRLPRRIEETGEGGEKAAS